MVAKLLHSPALPTVCEQDISMKILKTVQPESSDCAEVLYIYIQTESERETDRKGNVPVTVFLPIRWSAKQTNKKMEKFEEDWCMHFVVRLESVKLPGWIVTIKPFSSE